MKRPPAPLFARPDYAALPLPERCAALAVMVADYESHITGQGYLDVTAIRVALEESARLLEATGRTPPATRPLVVDNN